MTKTVTVGLFSAFLAFMPIIGIYASPIPGFNIAEVIIVLFWILFLTKKDLRVDTKYSIYLLLFVVYLFFSFLIASLLGVTTSEILFRTIRFSLYYMTVSLWTSKYLNTDTLFKWMRLVVYSACLFLLVQYAFFYVQGRVVMGFIPGLRIYQQIYETTDWVSKYTNYFRASAFFSEPAHLCQYFFIFLIFSLFGNERFNAIDVTVTTAGIILSTAGQGIVIGAGIWGLFFLAKAFGNKKSIPARRFALYLLSAFTIVTVSVLLTRTSVFQGTVLRLLNRGEQSSSYARLNVYTYLFDDLKGAFLLFGRGFGSIPKENVFVPGLAYTIYGSGILGLVLASFFIFKPLFSRNMFGKIISIVFIVLFVVSSVFMNIMGLLYLALMQNAFLGTIGLCSNKNTENGE